VWFREVPTTVDPKNANYYLRNTYDMRTFPTTLQNGFSWDQSIHDDVGVGLRFFLRSVAIPLVGVDVGWGIVNGLLTPQYLIVIGA